MAPDADLVERLREQLSRTDVREQRMFGGLAFLVDDRMVVAASAAGGLMLRCAPGDTEGLLTRPGVEPVVMRGREVRGWLRVEADAVADDDALAAWVDRATAYAATLPPGPGGR